MIIFYVLKKRGDALFEDYVTLLLLFLPCFNLFFNQMKLAFYCAGLYSLVFLDITLDFCYGTDALT